MAPFYGRCTVARVFDGTKDVFRALITKLEMTSRIYEPAPASLISLTRQNVFFMQHRILLSAAHIVEKMRKVLRSYITVICI